MTTLHGIWVTHPKKTSVPNTSKGNWWWLKEELQQVISPEPNRDVLFFFLSFWPIYRKCQSPLWKEKENDWVVCVKHYEMEGEVGRLTKTQDVVLRKDFLKSQVAFDCAACRVTIRWQRLTHVNYTNCFSKQWWWQWWPSTEQKFLHYCGSTQGGLLYFKLGFSLIIHIFPGSYICSNMNLCSIPWLC